MSGRIEARELGKKYKRYRSHWRRLTEWLTAGRYHGHEELWALRQVSFEVAPGEGVGIVGQNGAGKSTLLKLIVGTTRPSCGEFRVEGRVAALLELGMGFHPDFNGRQNARMALQLQGFDERHAEEYLPEITRFSELGDFMGQPLRTYSSGMQMRLGFAVATTRRPDILIVDEALSVGDAYFQHKCIRRIREFKEAGTTMLFVSHDPAAVKTLCDRALLLDGGLLVREGPAEAVLDYYNAMIARREKEASIRQVAADEGGRLATRSGDGRITISAVELVDEEGRRAASFATGEPATFVVGLEFHEEVDDYTVGILIRDRLGNEIFGSNTHHLGVEMPPGRAGERAEARFATRLELGYGHYSLTVAVHSPTGHLSGNHDWIDNAAAFQVIPGDASRFAGVAHLPVSAEVRPT
ncbi:MAG: ABC transporter ATP-binding protein [Thermoanaerobaculia bacterium]|nr:ABC transporter ATP-binding protein [Thermoanaerobaculia bacterium]